MIKKHQNEHQHNGHHGGVMVNIHFSGTGNLTILVNLEACLTHNKSAAVELWFEKVVGESRERSDGTQLESGSAHTVAKDGEKPNRPSHSLFLSKVNSRSALTTSLMKPTSWFL